jgi:group II intron reverse transcriptase/maturase
VDTGRQADEGWLLDIQRKLYEWSQGNPDEAYRDMWKWVTDPRNLRCAWRRVASNIGRRTPGIDGETVESIVRKQGVLLFLEGLRQELRDGSYRPAPARRKWIPKPGKPGKYRPLGIPTVKDRVVQSAVLNIIEPVFEADFAHTSYGFRPGRGCHGALEHIRRAIQPMRRGEDGRRTTPPYQWAIEGDIKGCFDHIDHHLLMDRVRLRIRDRKVTRLITSFLKAGVLEDMSYLRTDAGTPQGGIISPLLCNVALSVIEQHYARWVDRNREAGASRHVDGVRAAAWARGLDRKQGRPVFLPIRYADDWVVLVSGPLEAAQEEKQLLEGYLKETAGLELSPEKTKITPLTQGVAFLGHRVRLKWDRRWGWHARVEIPKTKILDFRYRVKQLTKRRSAKLSLCHLLDELNAFARGWGHFYRHCLGAKRIFYSLDWYVSDRIWRWLCKKYPTTRRRKLLQLRQASRVFPGQRVWQMADREQFLLGRLPVQQFRLGWMRRPAYA